jgi:hypothetical protein
MLGCVVHSADAGDDVTLDAVACIRVAIAKDVDALGVLLDGRCHICLAARTADVAAMFISQLADHIGTTPEGWLAAVTTGMLQLLATGPDDPPPGEARSS